MVALISATSVMPTVRRESNRSRMADPNTLLTALSRLGWKVARNRQRVDLLPDEVRKRYPRLPADIEVFLGELDSCFNSNETVWFLTHADFRPSLR